MKRNEIMQARDAKIYKANELIRRARYDLNPAEQKVLNFVFSQVRAGDTAGAEYSFTAVDFFEICGMNKDSGSNYARAKRIIKGLRDKSFWLQREDGTEALIGWLVTATVKKSSGWISVTLDPRVQEFVKALRDGNFTQFELLATLPMQSQYSIRLYELLRSYSWQAGQKGHTFNVDDLKKQLGAVQYENFKDFRRRVIELGVKEINQFTDIHVSWTPIRMGRSIERVQFAIEERDYYEKVMAAKRANEALDADQLPGQMSLTDYPGIIPKN